MIEKLPQKLYEDLHKDHHRTGRVIQGILLIVTAHYNWKRWDPYQFSKHKKKFKSKRRGSLRFKALLG